MTNKKYLRRYLETIREIHTKLDQISSLRDMAEHITTTLSPGSAGAGGSGADKIGSIVAQIADTEREVEADVMRLADVLHEVELTIETVDDAALRTLLRYRYVSGLAWERIAERMGYSYRWILRLHNRALNSLKINTP